MACAICEKWFNSQLLEEILKILPQSLGRLLSYITQTWGFLKKHFGE